MLLSLLLWSLSCSLRPLFFLNASLFSMPPFFSNASLLWCLFTSLIVLFFIVYSTSSWSTLYNWCLSSSPKMCGPLYFFDGSLLHWSLSSSSFMPLFSIDASFFIQCLSSLSMLLFFINTFLLFGCLSSSLMTLFFVNASSMILLCPCLHLFLAHCVMPGRLKTMSVCALLREEKPAMHWQRGKKYLHYKELCLNLGQHLFNCVLFRNISQEWPFKSWKVLL